MQTNVDRYRDVSYSKGDNHRVSLKPEIVLGLVGTPPYVEDLRLYAQAGSNCIDVMTNSYRLERLKTVINEASG
jgi:hypothetical protein